MKKFGLIVGLLLVGVAAIFWLRLRPADPFASGIDSSRKISSGRESGSVAVRSSHGTVAGSQTNGAAGASVPLAARAGKVESDDASATPNLPPDILLQTVRRAITQFGATFGGNPVGTNPEFTAALRGKNKKQIDFIDPGAGIRIDEKGEMLDSWGTPLFFHQMSGSETEVRSAGPDRKMWTADDLVTR